MDYIILCNGEDSYMRKKRNLVRYLETRCCDKDSFGLCHGFKGYVIRSDMRAKKCLIDDLFKCYDRFMFMTEQQLHEWRAALSGEYSIRIAFIDNLGIEYLMSKDSVRIQRNDAKYGYGLLLNYVDCNFGIMAPYFGALHSPHTFDGDVDNPVPGSSKVDWDVRIVYKESGSLDASTIKKGNMPYMNMKVKNVIFSGPATIVFWKDGTKTVTKCREGEVYSKEAGLAMCFMKKAIGDRTKFQKVMKKWIPETSKTEEKNPREGDSFDEYLDEQLKDPEFKKQYENAEITNKSADQNDFHHTVVEAMKLGDLKKEPSPLKKAADLVVEAMKLGDLDLAGKIIEDYKKEENNDGNKTTL